MRIDGTSGADTLPDTVGNDQIYGLAGNDTMSVTYGIDYVNGGTGDDTLVINWGDAVLDAFVGGSIVSYVNTHTYWRDSTHRVEHYNIEHFDAQTGSGDDKLTGFTNQWDKMNGGAGIDLWVDNFSASTVSMDVDMSRIASAEGQSFADGTIVRNIEHADLHLTQANDSFTDHGANDDEVRGQGGNDEITTDGGNDSLYGDDGDDRLGIGQGINYVNGGTGDDTLVINWGDAVLDAFVGGSIVSYVNTHTYWRDSTHRVEHYNIEHFDATLGAGNDRAIGLDSDDVFRGGGGADTLIGHAGNDTLVGGSGRDILDGGEGADVLQGNFGRDTALYSDSSSAITVDLGLGTGLGGEAEGDTFNKVENITGSGFADTIIGNGTKNKFIGGNGNDTLKGGKGNDNLNGDAGNDMLLGQGGRDVLNGKDNDDTLSGGGGNDKLNGGTGNDRLNGQNGNDKLKGDIGNDVLNGQRHNDRLDGGAGDDMLTGGGGKDRFVFNGGNDRITDFSNNTDTILLDADALRITGDTVSDVLGRATKTSGSVYFDFGSGNVLVVEDFSNIAALQDDMLII